MTWALYCLKQRVSVANLVCIMLVVHHIMSGTCIITEPCHHVLSGKYQAHEIEWLMTDRARSYPIMPNHEITHFSATQTLRWFGSWPSVSICSPAQINSFSITVSLQPLYSS